MARGLTTAELDKIAPAPRGLTTEELNAATEAGNHPVQAALEGVARTATFGASDEVVKGFNRGYEPADAVKARRDQNPIASGAGELAGLFTPGPGLAVRAGEGAHAAMLAAGAGKTAARLAGGAVEGGLFGLGSAITEDNMGDPGLTSEHVAAGTLGAALLGSGMHTVFGKAGDLGKSALVKAFGGKAVSATLDDLAEQSVMKSVMRPSDLGKKSLRGRVNEVGRFAIDEGLTAGAPSMATANERAAARAQDAWAGIENNLGVADTMAPFDSAAVKDRMQPLVDGLKNNPAMAEIKNKLQTFVNRFDPANGEAPDSFAKAWDTASKMWDSIGSMEAKGLKSEMKHLRLEFQDEIFGQVAKVDPQLGADLQKANRDYANAATFRDLTKKKADDIAAGGFSLTDLLTGGGLTHALGPVGLAAPLVSRGLRERGGFMMGSALEALNASGALPKIADAFQLMMRTRLSNPGFGGAFRATLETAAAKGSMDLLQTHLGLANDPEYMASVGLEHEDPKVTSAYIDKAHRLGQLSNAVDGAGAEIDKSIGRLLGEQPGRTPAGRADRQPTREEFEAIRAKLKILESDDGQTRKHLDALAPTTAGLASMSIVAAAKHLLDTAPKNPTEGLPPAFQKPWNPAKSDLRSWFRRVDTVADPRSVLDAMREGKVTAEQIETLGIVYPRLLKDFRDRMTTRLSAWQQPLDRRRQGQVGQLIGEFGDPGVAQMIQGMHARAIPPPTNTSDGRQKVDAVKNEETQGQRLEATK